MNGSEMQRNIEAILRSPSESLDVEIKGWLDPTNRGKDRANLAKAMIALANHGGGFILIGFTESPEGHIPSTERPPDLGSYSTDTINDIVKRYAEPLFHCELYHVLHPETEDKHPVIHVPGGHSVPIRSKRAGPGGQAIRQDVYYIRRPGPASESPQSGQEWNGLVRRCIVNAKSELAHQFRLILEGGGAARTPEPNELVEEWRRRCVDRWRQVVREGSKEDPVFALPDGFYSFAYMFEGVHERFPEHTLLEALRWGPLRYTGWPPFLLPEDPRAQPYPYEDDIECWLGNSTYLSNNPTYVDFWRVSSTGRFFLLRGYQEDGHETIAPGTKFDLTLPTWRLGEVLLHAASVARRLDLSSARVVLTIMWNGLSGRRLSTAWSPRRSPVNNLYVCRQESYRATVEQRADQIDDTLPELVTGALTSLYAKFSFFQLPPRFVVEELNLMRKGRY